MRVFRHSENPLPSPRYHPRDNCTRQDRGRRVTEFLSRSVFWDYIKCATDPYIRAYYRLRFPRDDIFRGYRF